MPATSRVVPPFFATTLPAAEDFGALTLLPALVSVATASAPAIKNLVRSRSLRSSGRGISSAAVLDLSNPRRRATVASPCRASLGMLILRRGSALRTAGTSCQVQVRMQDGGYRNFNYSTQPPVQVGGHVRVSVDSLTTSSSPREPTRPSRVTAGYRFDIAASPASARHP
jgi:hypothetical protein